VKLLRLSNSFENQRLNNNENLESMRQMWHNVEMAKSILISFAILFSTQAMAKSDCYLLLTPHVETPLSEQQLTFEGLWMESQGATLDGGPAGWTSQNILQRWNSWAGLTRAQRDQALTLELLKISPRTLAAQPLIPLDSKEQFAALSAKNEERMLKQLEAAFPVSRTSRDNPELNKLANSLVSRIKFQYGRPVNPMQFTHSPDGYNAPVASPRELTAIGVETTGDFYSELIGRSPSVEFITLAVQNTRAGAPLGTILRRETLLLNNKFAEQNGIALPRFANVRELLDFFEFWDPTATEEVFRANWNSLPFSMRTYEDFRPYVEMNQDEVFPHDKMFNQLAALRMRLNQYAMTTADSEEFLKRAFRHYVLSLGDEDSKVVAKLKMDTETTSGIIQLFRSKFFPFLHMPAGMALRIPVAVTSSQYNLSRVDDSSFSFSNRPTTARSNGPFTDHRSMDHSNKP